MDHLSNNIFANLRQAFGAPLLVFARMLFQRVRNEDALFCSPIIRCIATPLARGTRLALELVVIARPLPCAVLLVYESSPTLARHQSDKERHCAWS